MSAPQTNIEKQTKHHWGPLAGMALVVLFAVGVILFWLFGEFSGTTTTDDQHPTLQDAGAVDTGDTGALPSRADPLAAEPTAPTQPEQPAANP